MNQPFIWCGRALYISWRLLTMFSTLNQYSNNTHWQLGHVSVRPNNFSMPRGWIGKWVGLEQRCFYFKCTLRWLRVAYLSIILLYKGSDKWHSSSRNPLATQKSKYAKKSSSSFLQEKSPNKSIGQWSFKFDEFRKPWMWLAAQYCHPLCSLMWKWAKTTRFGYLCMNTRQCWVQLRKNYSEDFSSRCSCREES